MKLRRLLFVTLAGLIVTTLFTAVASAQNYAQEGKSADLVLPTNATGNYETGGKQVDVHMEGHTDNKSSQQPVESQPTHPREKPPKAAAAPAPPPVPAPKELPKSGGSSAASLFSLGAGALLVAGGLLVRRLVR